MDEAWRVEKHWFDISDNYDADPESDSERPEPAAARFLIQVSNTSGRVVYRSSADLVPERLTNDVAQRAALYD
jgi:hypothetical protein